MTTPESSARRRRLEMAAIVVASGILGFRAGAVQFPTWQVAVETAQVVARIVRYPAQTPFSVYHAELWTVLHQVLAVFLRLGVSEATLSRMLSGVMGMLSFQAIALIVYATSADALVAVGACALALATHTSEFGVLYPIYLTGVSHTYGIVGLSFFALVIGLFGTGNYRTAAFFLGVAPAIHPSLGAWLSLIVGIALASDFRRARIELRQAVVPFLVGAGITGCSLLVNLAMRDAVPSIDASEAARYFDAFVSFWDGHRQPVPVEAVGVALNTVALLVSGIWLVAFMNDLTRSAQLLCRIVFVTTALSLGLVVISWVPPERLPQWLLVLMPARLLNVGAMICVPLLLGLIALYRRTTWGSLLALTFVPALLLVDHSRIRAGIESRLSLPALPLKAAAVVSAMALVLFVLVLRAWNQRRIAGDTSSLAANATPLPFLQVPARWLTVALLAAVTAWAWTRPAAQLSTIFVERTNDTALQLAADGQGLLLTGGNLHLMQLRTRRPVLLDGGGLDGIAYSISAAPQMERILRDVYGVDYFHPPEEARRTGMVPAGFGQKVWEARTPDEWMTIAQRYGVTDIITPSEWSLTLPVAAQSRDFRLYRILH